MTDGESIKKVLDGDSSAFRDILERHQDKIFRLCAGMVGDSNADDAAQESFLKAYKNLSRFNGQSQFSTWLYRIASNHCLDMIKKRRAQREESLEKMTSETGDSSWLFADKSSFTTDVEKRETVKFLLDRLSPDEKIILVLREQEGLTYDEIAETLEISLETVKIRLYRARESLVDKAKSHHLIK